MIGNLNTRVTVKHYTSVQDGTTGKISSMLSASWTKWAETEETNGSRTLDNAAITYKKTYKLKMRFEQTRPTVPGYILSYSGNEMIVHSVIKEQEGKAWYENITAYTQ